MIIDIRYSYRFRFHENKVRLTSHDGGDGGECYDQRPFLQPHFESAELVPRPADLDRDIVWHSDGRHESRLVQALGFKTKSSLSYTALI